MLLYKPHVNFTMGHTIPSGQSDTTLDTALGRIAPIGRYTVVPIYTRASSARQLASAQLVTPAELPNRELSYLIWDHCHVWQVTKNGVCGFSRYSVVSKPPPLRNHWFRNRRRYVTTG